MLQKFSYKKAASLQEAIAASGRPKAHILAGGCDLLGCLRDGVFTAESVVSISAIAELKGIAPRPGGGLRIGALTTLAEIAGHKQVVESYRALAEAATSVASPQLRNQGTIGGNLCQRPRCWYFRGDFLCRRKGGETCFAETGENQNHAIFGWDRCYAVHPSDTASALVALGARVTIAGPRGRRTIPLESFFVLPKVTIVKENVLLPGEVVTEILLDAPPAGLRSTYRKVRERGAFDFALAGAAIAVTVAEGKVTAARVVISGVAAAPWRSAEAEKAIVGKALDEAAVQAAAQAAVKDAAALEKNGYKIALVRGILEETLLGLGKA
jgi:xanthine dehydrogenase YagS FAD-binding subunit